MDTVNLILGLVGLVGISGVWRFGHALRRQLYTRRGSPERVRKEVCDIVRRRTYPYSQREAGTYESVAVDYFVDLLGASGSPADRDVMDRWLTRWVYLQQLRPTHIAVPKRGNVVLASMVARRLSIPLVVIYQENSLHQRPYEGSLSPGDHVVLVDDVSSDAEFLLKVVDRLTGENVYVEGVVVLVDRKEGRCAAALTQRGIPFYPVMTLADVDLRSIIKQGRVPVAASS